MIKVLLQTTAWIKNIIPERQHERKWTVQSLGVILQLVVQFALNVQHSQEKGVGSELSLCLK